VDQFNEFVWYAGWVAMVSEITSPESLPPRDTKLPCYREQSTFAANELNRGSSRTYLFPGIDIVFHFLATVCRENLDTLEKEIPNSKGYVCDAADSASVHATVSQCITELGGVDVLIYNAGVGYFKSFDETTEEELEQCWSGGPKGLFTFAKALVPHFNAEGGGAIGVTGATASWRGMPATSAFASSKFALRGLCQSLARDLGPKNIHVFHVVIDGIIDMPKTRQWIANKPTDEFLDPEHIADLYWYLTNQDKRCWTYELNVSPGVLAGSMVSI